MSLPTIPAWQLRMLAFWLPFMAACIGSEWGADLHLPWYVLLGLVVGSIATGWQAMKRAAATPAAWPWVILGTVGGYALIWGSVWAGENGAETIHQPWRWGLAAFVCALWAEGWAQDPAAAPRWLHALLPQKQD